VRYLLIDHRFVIATSADLPTLSAWQVRLVSFVIACTFSASANPDWPGCLAHLKVSTCCWGRRKRR